MKVLWLFGCAVAMVLAACSLPDLDPNRGESPPAGSAGGTTRAEVLRVSDGDTIRVSIGGRREYVRYIGIDTPETVKEHTPVQCYGPEAHDFNEKLVGGRTVRLVFDRELRDRYDRMLAYVYAGDRFVNAEMLRFGYARPLRISPNTRFAELFDRLARLAGRLGRGLWGACRA